MNGSALLHRWPPPIRTTVSLLAVPFFLMGCLTPAPFVPHPTVVRAPHPDQADPSLDRETLREMYTASPDVNPDGLGPFEWIWDQSHVTLVVKPLAEKEEDLAGLAYARTEREQSQSLAGTRHLLENFVVFQGFLVGDYSQYLNLDVYKPEGIYLVDGRGEKFYPVDAHTKDWVVPQFGIGTSEFDTAHYRLVSIAFPRRALMPDTQSISLYLATPQVRLRFTWIFDPDLAPPEGHGIPGPRQLWSVR